MSLNLADWTDVYLIAPIIVLLIGSLIPVTVKVLRGNREQAAFASLLQGVFVLFVSGAFVFVEWDNLREVAFNNALVFDGLTSVGSLLVLGISMITLIFCYSNEATKGGQFSENIFLILSACLGMIVLLQANDLIVMFIALELMSLALYIVIAISSEQKLSKEASFKYFILGGFASAFFLYGTALIYGAARTTLLSGLLESAPVLMTTNKIFLIGMILLIVGICFKVSIFPFHAWTPDVYQGAPTPITGFMATGVKLSVFVVFLRVAWTKGFLGAPDMATVLEWLAVLTMFVGNLAAMKQTSMKRMLAYSSIAHSGYAAVGLISAGISQGEGVGGGSGLLFYLFVYALMNLGAFGLIGLLERREDTNLRLSDLKGFASNHPGLALALSVFLFSLAGLPPTAGFLGKFYIFSFAIEQGLYWLVFWGVINSVISVYYYLRPIINMYMFDPDGESVVAKKDWLPVGTVFVMALLILVVGIGSKEFWSRIYSSVASVF